MKFKHVPVFVLVGFLAILSGMPLLSSGSVTNYAYARYAPNTQSQANSNECNTGTNCGITSPQTQADGTANSPTDVQISKFNEEEGEQEDGVGVGITPEEVIVTDCRVTDSRSGITIVTCRASITFDGDFNCSQFGDLIDCDFTLFGGSGIESIRFGPGGCSPFPTVGPGPQTITCQGLEVIVTDCRPLGQSVTCDASVTFHGILDCVSGRNTCSFRLDRTIDGRDGFFFGFCEFPTVGPGPQTITCL